MSEGFELPHDREAKVLVVDDNPSNCRLLSNYLSTTPYSVITANSGFDALQIVEDTPPDIILLDIMMPEMNGFEVCSKIKDNPDRRDIPIIFFSAQAETDDKLRGFNLGAVDYVTKPIKKSEIIARIRTHLTIRFQQLELQQKNEALNELTEALRKRETQLEEMNDALERMARYDPLTGLCNRRYFFELAHDYWCHSQETGTPLAVLMMDIDFFKQYNDSYGHLAGDACLTKVATTIKDSMADEAELPARYGGEEFIVVLVGQSPEKALKKAQEICRRVYDQRIPNAANFTTKCITISVGVAHGVAEEDMILEDLIACADIALYQAKQQGRNRVLEYQPGMKQKHSMSDDDSGKALIPNDSQSAEPDENPTEPK